MPLTCVWEREWGSERKGRKRKKEIISLTSLTQLFMLVPTSAHRVNLTVSPHFQFHHPCPGNQWFLPLGKILTITVRSQLSPLLTSYLFSLSPVPHLPFPLLLLQWLKVAHTLDWDTCWKSHTFNCVYILALSSHNSLVVVLIRDHTL